jgi:hypothetical protein
MISTSTLSCGLGWLLVAGLSVSFAVAVGVVANALTLLEPVLNPMFETECSLEQLPYQVIWPDEPDNFGIRCVRLMGMEPILPGDPSSALQLAEWTGEDVVHGTRAFHRGSALMHSRAGPTAQGFVEMLIPGTFRSANDPVDLDITLASGNWARPERLRVSGWWKQEWVLTEAL